MSSKTIDQRVVEMRFDNKHFETNVATTMSTISKLKQSLNLTGASKGLENVSAAAKNCNMSGISNAVDTIKNKFSTLEVMAITALVNITNSAVNAGKRIISSLTIDPVLAGFNEYETKINAIQTIMSNTASKGTTMDDVTRVIDELNTYADKTIYNFAEMTRNIGTFTAAGVGLEESASAIQGIANLAAASGSNSQQASTAMYQLSQALATGTVRLMDWNSVVNAGMGGEKFQEALKATAKEYGVNVDKLIKKNGSFRDSLQEGWLSADILNTTLKKFTVEGAKDYAKSMMDSGKWTQEQADALIAEAQAMEDAATKVKTFTQLWDTLKESAQSGWAQSWEIIIGDFEEAKDLLTEVNDVLGGFINTSADARNEVLRGWKELGGRTALIEAIRNAFEGIVSIITPIKEAFREIFPPVTAKQLLAFSEALRDLMGKLKLSDTTSKNLKRTFKGLFALLDVGKQAISAVFKAIKPLIGGLGDLGGGILDATATWGDWMVKLNEFIKTSNIFNTVMQGIVRVVDFVVKGIKSFINLIKEKILFPGWELFHGFLERIHRRMSQVGDAADEMGSGVAEAVKAMGDAMDGSKFVKMLEALWNGIKTIGSGIVKALGALTDGLVDKISNADFSGIFDIINTATIGGIAIGITKFVNGFGNVVKSVASLKDSIIGILNSVRGCFEAYQTKLKADTLLKIATAIGILAASITVISLIDSEKLSVSLGAITVLFADLIASLALFGKISGKLTGVFRTCTAMISISLAVLILASALKKIGDLEFSEMITGLVGVVGLTATMIATAKIMSSGGPAIVKGAAQMVIFAAAIKVLASACADLSELSWEQLAKGLVGVGVLIAEITVFLKVAKFSGKTLTTATGIVVLAAAIKVLASACADFGEMDWEKIAKGLTAVGALLIEVAAFTKLTGNAKHVIASSNALIGISAAMKIFASVMYDLSEMTWEEIARGLTAMAGGLIAITAAVNLMPKNMISIGVGLIGVSTALILLSNALIKMGGMEWENIAKGLAALGGSIAILAVGLNAMKKTLPGSAAMLVATAALAVLTPILSILGAMSWGGIAKGLVAIAGAFTIFGVAGAILKPLVPTLLGLSASLTLFGIGIFGIGAGLLAAGAGLSALAVGFTALATAGASGATAIVASLTVIITGIASLIPAVIEKIGEGILAFCKVIAEGASAIGEAVKAVVLSLVDVLVECIPAIANGALELVAGVLEALVKYTPRIVDSLFQFLIGILEGIARNLPGLIKAAIDVLMSFFAGIIDALSDIDVGVLIKGLAGIGLLSGIMVALSAMASLVPGAMLGVLGAGVVIAELALVLAAIGALAQIPGLTWIINEGAKLMGAIGNAIGALVGGIIGGAMSQISSHFPKIGSDLSDFMKNVQPFLDGARSINPSMLDGVNALVGTIVLLTGANMLNGISKWFTGGASFVEFGEELAKFGVSLKKYSDSVVGVKPDVVKASANAAQAISAMANGLPKKGGVVSWFEGENSLSDFADELAKFGPIMKSYSDSVVGVKPDVVKASANAAQAMSEMAEKLPKRGGVVSWFEGENTLSDFAEELAEFGPSIKEYSDNVKGLKPEVVTASANAALSLAEMADKLPNQGGVVSWFTGDNKLSMFGEELALFGPAMKKYSDSVAGVNPETITASANAALSLAELANKLPNQGGVVSWFAGDNNIATFGDNLVLFGKSLKEYSNSVSGFDANSASVTASVNAAKALSEMCSSLHEVGGVVSWFAGEKDLIGFGNSLAPFGSGLKSYSESVAGFSDNSASVTASVNAAKALSEMYSFLHEVGGVVSWFAGEKDLIGFGDSLAPFGSGLKSYSESVAGFSDNSASVTASVNAAKALSEMYSSLHEIGGVASWFAGEKDLIGFGDSLISFGKSMKSYSDNVAGLSDNSASVTASVNAAKALSEMCSSLHEIGGVVSWFAGEKDLTGFGDSLISFGKGLKIYSDNVAGLSDNSASITASVNAAKALSEMYSSLDEIGGAASWFAGERDLSGFGVNLVSFGKSLSNYSYWVKDIVPEKLTSVTNVATSFADLQNNITSTGDGGILKNFGENLKWLGKHLNEYYVFVSEIDTLKLSAVIKETNKLVTMLKGMSDLNSSGADSFAKALTNVGQAGVDGFIKAFTNANDKATSAGSNFITSFVNGIKSRTETLNSTMSSTGQRSMSLFATGVTTALSQVLNAYNRVISMSITAIRSKLVEFYNFGRFTIERFGAGISSAVSTIREKYNEFYIAGKHLVEGFANGIKAYTYLAEARSKAMAAAAAKAAKKELDEHSPSRVGYGIGGYFGLGFVNAIRDYVSKAYMVSKDMATSAKKGLNSVASKIADYINGNIDTQPTIRPVLDLSNVASGTNSLNAMLSRTKAMSISSDMANHSRGELQNGEMTSTGNTYTFTQNNYSPKALSRLEIYRQTRNQFSMMKGLVKT